MIGQAAVSLHRQHVNQAAADADTATENALTAAAKACKPSLSEGAGDYVWHSVKGMAKVWFEENSR